jgi:hypothetical protein
MLPEITKNNHFEFESVQLEDKRQFFVRIGVPEKKISTPFDQGVQDVQYFYDKLKQKKITLCLSGGIDSEAMARVYLAAGVEFEVAFLRFKDDLNLFDISTNIEFCKSNNIKHHFIDLDIIQFLESGTFLEWAEKYECQSPQLATHLWLLDQVDGTPCLSGNPIAPIWNNQKWFFIGLPGELHATYFKYFFINSREGMPWFFLYSPELIKSFFHLPCMQPYINQQILNPAQYTYLEKCKSYTEGGFVVLPRQNKFTGFEMVRQYYDVKCNTQFGMGFDNLFRKPLEKVFSFPDEYFQLIPKDYLIK